MQNWLLQTLSDIFNRSEYRTYDNREQEIISAINSVDASQDYLRLSALKAQREWFGAIAAIEKLLLSITKKSQDSSEGVIFSAPVPILSNLSLLSSFKTGVFTLEAFTLKALMPCGEQKEKELRNCKTLNKSQLLKLPLIPNDPIAKEQFCLILTTNFSLIMVLGQNIREIPTFHFSFAPEIVQEAWATLRSRLSLVNHEKLSEIDGLIEKFQPVIPDYRLVSQFSRELLYNLPNLTALAIEGERATRLGNISNQPVEDRTTSEVSMPSVATAPPSSELEMELLQALTHEIRTPLTTIRTLTRLLLKGQKDFQPKVTKRLQTIDQECTEQIERMELIFRAAELESTPPTSPNVHLTSCCLESVLEQTIPRWKKQAKRRNISLDVTLPRKLPKVVSDPAMLDRVLTGLIESCTKSLPQGGKIRVSVSTAGDRLKLQVISQSINNPLKALGQLLMFQPETGSLTLNLEVTKNMFQALGGKLTVRQRPRQGEELTIFLPLNN